MMDVKMLLFWFDRAKAPEKWVAPDRRAMIGSLLALLLVLAGCAAPYAAAPAAAGGESAAAPAAELAAAEAESSESPAGLPAASLHPASNHSAQYEAVTAGVTDDNVNWREYLDYRARHRDLWVNDRDVSERYLIRVVDQDAIPVHDTLVKVYGGDRLLFEGRTDAGGEMLFHPRALSREHQGNRSHEFSVVASKGYVAQSRTFDSRSGEQWTLLLNDPPRGQRTQLDLLFLLDATGSMDDEIDKLKASMANVADQITNLPEQPDVRYGLVAYRDRGDDYVVRPYDFTYDLYDFQRNLAAVDADGGGDTPESLNEALHVSLNGLSWRNEETVRLILLVADAPPHLDYGEPFSYDTDMIDAVRRGIKIFPVGASNLDVTGEYVFRQLAQFTGGKFVFLTYEEGSNPGSGPGAETEHEVDNYSVDTLDRLVVRLVREELAKLSTPHTAAAQPVAQLQKPTPIGPITCTFDLSATTDNCSLSAPVSIIPQGRYELLLVLTLDPQATGYDRARFDITYGGSPRGSTVDLSQAALSEPLAGNPAEGGASVSIVDGELLVYGAEDTPTHATLDGDRLVLQLNDAVRSGETLSLELSHERLAVNSAAGIEVLESPYLYTFGDQQVADSKLYAGFNGRGSGVSKVVVTLYPVR